jgi:hypothetical protein
VSIPVVIPTLLLLSVAAGAPPVDPSAVTRARPQLHTPDQIAPAVLPYLACLYAERGLPLLHASDGAQVAYDKSTSDCSAARSQAKADAAKLLQGKPVPDGVSAGEFIDRTLADMDSYVASLPTSNQAHPSTQAAVIGIPVTIEDEVQPAYTRYDDCLKTQVSNTPVTADAVIKLFRQAMTICGGVRDYAVSEAAKALIAKGWDQATRERAAQSTFAKVDESWLAMGHQYQEMLLQRAAKVSTSRVPKPASDKRK